MTPPYFLHRKSLADIFWTTAVTSTSIKDCMRSLRVESPLKDKQHFQKEIGEQDHKTYHWVQVNGVYIQWLNEDDDTLLWIHGEDGQGKTPFTISLINALTDKMERSSRRRALAYVFCASADGGQKDAPTMIRSIIGQILSQGQKGSPEVSEPWIQAHKSQGDQLLSQWQVLWVILQKILAKAKIEVAYFVLYRPEECGSSIMDVFPQLRPSHTKCHIKWVIISSKHPDEYSQIRDPLRVDLGAESSMEFRHTSGNTSTAPTTPDFRRKLPSRSTSCSSIEGSMPYLGEELGVIVSV